MKIKTMLIIIITILFTVVIMQNTEPVPFEVLFAHFSISKMLLLLIVAVIAFLFGIYVGRPRKARYIPGQVESADIQNKKASTLSDEDREYIN